MPGIGSHPHSHSCVLRLSSLTVMLCRPSGSRSFPSSLTLLRACAPLRMTTPLGMTKLLLVATLALAGCTAASAPAPANITTAAITPEDLRQRLYLIADDSMMGRETGSAGAFKTADYVANEFRRLGLEPAG